MWFILYEFLFSSKESLKKKIKEKKKNKNGKSTWPEEGKRLGESNKKANGFSQTEEEI